MRWIRHDVLSGKLTAGTFLNLGSPASVEIAGLAGFDWLLIDLEHGVGDEASLMAQLQAAASTPAAPIVRVAWNDVTRFKRVLDLGAAGVMVPYVNSPDEARSVVSFVNYPPRGVRGVARFIRASGFGMEFSGYFSEANDNLLTVVQIETPQAVAKASEIAAVDGIDVLFIGPLDLSSNMGISQQIDHPDFREAVGQVITACRESGKIAGTLVMPGRAEQAVKDGFTFLAVGSDIGAVSAGMKGFASELEKFRG